MPLPKHEQSQLSLGISSEDWKGHWTPFWEIFLPAEDASLQPDSWLSPFFRSLFTTVLSIFFKKFRWFHATLEALQSSHQMETREIPVVGSLEHTCMVCFLSSTCSLSTNIFKICISLLSLLYVFNLTQKVSPGILLFNPAWPKFSLCNCISVSAVMCLFFLNCTVL
jgi:hypothetical protein